MSGMADLTIGIVCDPSSLTAGMTEARDQISQTTTVIETQDVTWKAFTESVLGSVARIVAPILKLVNTYKQIQLATIALTIAQTAAIPPTLTLAGAMGFLLSPITLIVAGLAICAAAFYFFTRRADDAAAATEGIAESADQAKPKLGAIQSALDAVKNAVFGEETSRKISVVSTEFDKLKSGLADLRASIEQPFREGAAALASYAASFLPAESAADLAIAWLRGLQMQLEFVQASADKAKNSLLAALLIFGTGASDGQAAQFVAAGQAITDQAKATDLLIAKMQSQREAFASLRAMQEGAEQAAKNSAEVGKIGSIFTVEGINAEVIALQQRSAAVVLTGKADEAWKDQTKSLFDALEKQRQGIINGTVVDRAAEEAKKALAKAEADAARAAADAAAKEEQKTQSGLAKIASIQDQIDLLTGSATKAEIAMREMARQGFSTEQVDEVGRLTAELDRLEKEKSEDKKTGKKSSGNSDLKAAFAGSQEAASIVLRGVGGKSMEQIAQKQLTVQQQLLVETKANKPQTLMAANL